MNLPFRYTFIVFYSFSNDSSPVLKIIKEMPYILCISSSKYLQNSVPSLIECYFSAQNYIDTRHFTDQILIA